MSITINGITWDRHVCFSYDDEVCEHVLRGRSTKDLLDFAVYMQAKLNGVEFWGSMPRHLKVSQTSLDDDGSIAARILEMPYRDGVLKFYDDGTYLTWETLETIDFAGMFPTLEQLPMEHLADFKRTDGMWMPLPAGEPRAETWRDRPAML